MENMVKLITKNKKILITGSTGFVGANLLHYLVNSDNEIHIFLRETSNIWRIKDVIGRVNKHYCDLANREKTRKIVSNIKPEIIINLSTYGGYPFQKDSTKIINTNFMGTINLLDACIEMGFNFFINTGSSSEYGIKNKPMSESDLLEPIDIYGASKSAATLYCQALAKKYNLPIFTLRLFSPYGYYEESTRLIPYLTVSMLKNKKIKISSPYAVRDFIFIEDVIDAFIKIIDKKGRIPTGTILNVGSGFDTKVIEVFEILKGMVDYKINFNVEGFPRESDKLQVWRANTKKIQKTLGWRPKYNLENGLIKTVKWFRENIHIYEGEI
ncbi:NAD-dependent dehydratase [Candidatus Atribacteria bacterium HGW-Atribacteria-1]|nr:MAG: NAD-dependent dehydratase [Candidatus Atribacteria bacterium HGW-Atribacteria-1]